MRAGEINESVGGWHQAKLIRQFTAAYGEKVAEWPREKQDSAKRWMTWALEQADRLDPFVLESQSQFLTANRKLLDPEASDDVEELSGTT